MLTAADIAYMQDTQEEAMPGTVVVERYTLTPAGDGTNYEAWAAAGTVIGRVYPKSVQGGGMEAVGGAQVLSTLKWWATLPIGTVISARDRIVYSGRSWEVLHVNNAEMWQTAVRCELESNNEERRT